MPYNVLRRFLSVKHTYTQIEDQMNLFKTYLIPLELIFEPNTNSINIA